MMIWTLVFIGLMSPIFGMFVVKRTSIHQTKNNNITFGWDSQTKTDLSLTNLVCFFLSEPLKVLYEMINGAEHPESQHQQFSGRVQLDRDALTEGQIRLHLTRVTAEDSGNYRCDVAANYDQIMRRWELEASEHYVLNVTQTSHGDNSDVFSPTPKVTPGKKTTVGVRCHDWKTVKEVLGVANIVLMIFAGVAVLISAAVTHLREFIHLRFSISLLRSFKLNYLVL